MIKDATGVALMTVISGARSVSAASSFAVRVAIKLPSKRDMRMATSILKIDAPIICQKDAIKSMLHKADAASMGEGSRNLESICHESAAHTNIQKTTEADTLIMLYNFLRVGFILSIPFGVSGQFDLNYLAK